MDCRKLAALAPSPPAWTGIPRPPSPHSGWLSVPVVRKGIVAESGGMKGRADWGMAVGVGVGRGRRRSCCSAYWVRFERRIINACWT